MTIADVTAESVLALDPAAQGLLFRDARTANTFTDEPVTDEQIRAVHDLVKWGPTGLNQQPLRIVLSRSAESRERLVAHLNEGNKAKTRTAPLVALLAADLDFHENLPAVYPLMPGARDLYAANEAGREASARLNAALQIGYFLIGVRAAGLAAGPMGGFDTAGMDAEFFPDGRHRSLLVVNIGHPGPGAFRDRQPRLDFDEVARIL